MRGEVDKDHAIAELATRQFGVVTRAQLRALGLRDGAVDRRLASGRLQRVHRGVHAVGHTALRAEGRMLAAALACGPGAVLSHATAAEIWDLRRSAAARIDVTVPHARGRRGPSAIRLHRHAALRGDEVTTRDGLPVTTVPRTLLDLATILPRRALERALDQAEALRLFDLTALRAVADGRAGSVALRRALREHDAGTTLTRSELEERLVALCDAHGLPRPRVNRRVEGLEVDALFPAARLVVEADGFTHHGTRRAFERDRARDARLIAAGYRVLRLTHRRLTGEPEAVAAQLAAALTPR